MKRAKYIVYYMVGSLFSLLALGSCSDVDEPVNDWSFTFDMNEWVFTSDEKKAVEFPFDVDEFDDALRGYFNYKDLIGISRKYYDYLWMSEDGVLSASADTINTAVLWVGVQPYKAYFDEVIHARSEALLPTIVVKDRFWNKEDCKPFDVEAFAQEVKENKGCRDSELKLLSSGKVCHLPTEMCKSRIHHDPTVPLLLHYTSHEVIATIDDEPIAIKYTAWGEAPLILVSTPLLFTNYGVTYDRENLRFILSLMEEALKSDAEMGVKISTKAWTSCYEKQTAKRLLYVSEAKPKPKPKSKPSDWNFDFSGLRSDLLNLLIVALFIGFLLLYARRRQRIIPVIKEPENRTVELAKQIGNKFYWKAESREVLRRKFVILLDWIRERTNIHFEDNESLEANVNHLARLLGERPQPLLLFFRRMFFLLQNSIIVSEKEMMDSVDKMNSIIKKLK